MSAAETRRTVELRGEYDRDLVEALDMIALAQRKTRTELVGQVLRRYVVAKQHEASLISRLPAVTPEAPDSGWSGLA